jgi:hypothetical protein
MKTIKTFIQIDFNHKFRFHGTFSYTENFKNYYFTAFFKFCGKLRAVLIFRLNGEYIWINVLVYGLVSFRIINSKLLLDLPCIKKSFKK